MIESLCLVSGLTHLYCVRDLSFIKSRVHWGNLWWVTTKMLVYQGVRNKNSVADEIGGCGHGWWCEGGKGVDLFAWKCGVNCRASESDSECIMVNQCQSFYLVIFPNIRGKASAGTKIIRKVQLVPFSKVIGTCMVLVENKVAFGCSKDTRFSLKGE